MEGTWDGSQCGIQRGRDFHSEVKINGVLLEQVVSLVAEDYRSGYEIKTRIAIAK